MQYPKHIRELAVRLRVVDRLSLKEIAARTGMSTATVSRLVRAWPLTVEEIAQKAAAGIIRAGQADKGR